MQRRAPFQGHPDPNSTCAKVMAFAKQRNSRELARLLRDGYALDEKSRGRDAIFYLMASFDLTSLLYLIHRFGLFNKQSMLQASAVAGDGPSIVALLQRDSSDAMLQLNQDHLLLIVGHFALGGHVEAAEALLSKAPPILKLNLILSMINGYVLNGSCQDQIDYWMSEPVIEELSLECNRSPLSIRDDFSRVVSQARAELGLELEVNSWNSSYMARGGHEARVFYYLDHSRADYIIRYQNIRMNGGDISELGAEIDNHGVSEAVAAVWFSSELALKIISSNFSASEKVIEEVISNGNYELAYTWLIWLSKSFWIDEVHRAYFLKKHANLASDDCLVKFQTDRIERYLSGKRSLDAVMGYQLDADIDQDIHLKGMRDSMLRFEGFLAKQMQRAIEGKHFSALNMLRDVGCQVLGRNIPEFEISKKWTDDRSWFAASSINDSDFRNEMLRRFHGGDQTLEAISKTSNLMNYLIRDYLLDFHLARLMFNPGMLDAYHWVEVYQRTNEGLPFDSNIFSLIFTMLLRVNEGDARAIYEAIMIHLFEHQPPGMNLQKKLDVFGLFNPVVQSSDYCLGNDHPVAYQMN